MNWNRESANVMRAGHWQISRARYKGEYRYTLWDMRDKTIRCTADTAAECKEIAEIEQHGEDVKL